MTKEKYIEDINKLLSNINIIAIRQIWLIIKNIGN